MRIKFSTGSWVSHIKVCWHHNSIKSSPTPGSTQLGLWHSCVPHLAQGSFLQKKIKRCKMLFFISVKLRWHSAARCHFTNKIYLKLQLPKNVIYKKCGPKLIYFNEKILRKIWTSFDFECPNFMIFDFTVPSQALQISKKDFATFYFFVKMKLVSNLVQP